MASAEAAPKAATLAGWKKNKRHYVTLPSSTVVGIEIPDIPSMIKGGSLPNSLIQAAVSTVQGGKKATADDIKEQAEFYDYLVRETVKDPVLSDADVTEIPAEDKEMIVEFALRIRDLDALGHHPGGLHTLKEWRQFRGLDYGDSTLEDV